MSLKLRSLSRFKFGLIAAGFVTATLTTVGHSESLSGEVVGVTDGDTIDGAKGSRHPSLLNTRRASQFIYLPAAT